MAISTCAGSRRSRKQGSLRFLERALDSGDSRVDLALGEPDEREPWLWLASELARGAIGVLGSDEVAAAPADLADLVPARSGDHLVEVLELLAGRERLRLRRRPVASQPHRLGAVDPAGAGEARDVQRVAPTIRRLRPLRRAPVVADVLAGADGDAVHEAGRVGADVAAERRGARLVEERETLVDLARTDEHAPLPRQREHLGVTVADALRELVRLVEHRDGGLELALHHRAERLHQEQMCMLGRFVDVVEESLGVGEPAVRDRERPFALVVPREGQRQACGAPRVSVRRVGGERLLAVTDRLVDLPAPPRRLAEVLEVGRRQSAGVGADVRRVRRTPGLPRCGRAGIVEGVEDLGHDVTL